MFFSNVKFSNFVIKKSIKIIKKTENLGKFLWIWWNCAEENIALDGQKFGSGINRLNGSRDVIVIGWQLIRSWQSLWRWSRRERQIPWDKVCPRDNLEWCNLVFIDTNLRSCQFDCCFWEKGTFVSYREFRVVFPNSSSKSKPRFAHYFNFLPKATREKVRQKTARISREPRSVKQQKSWKIAASVITIILIYIHIYIVRVCVLKKVGQTQSSSL